MPRQRRLPKLIRHERSPFWQYDFQLAGRRWQGSTGECDKTQAQAILEKIWCDALVITDNLRRSERQPMTITEAASRWWDEVGAHGREGDLGPFPSDNPNHRARPLAWLVDELGAKRPLHTIRDDDVARLVALRRKSVVREAADRAEALYRPVSARTVNRLVPKLLRRIMRKAVKSWNVEVHHMPDWSSHLIKEKKKPPRVITFAEQGKLAEIERPHLAAAREFALLTSLRLAEVVSLTWPQVDFLGGVIRVIQKGEDPRTVPISKEIEALLRQLKGQHPTAVFSFVAQRTRVGPHGEKFIRGQRYPLTYWGLITALRRDWRKAGVNGSFHDLRRTAAETMRAAGGSLDDCRELLGHKDIKTTEIYLGRRSIEDLRGVMDRRDAYVAAMREAAAIASPAPQKSRNKSRTVVSIGRKARR